MQSLFLMFPFFSSIRSSASFAFLCALSLSLASCGPGQWKHGPVQVSVSAEIEDGSPKDSVAEVKEELKDVLSAHQHGKAKQQKDIQQKDVPKSLPYSPVILAPEVPEMANSKLVSMSVTEDVPIKDVLMELSRLADLEVAIDPNISGGIILKVKDRPIQDVIEMVAEQASLRYTIENGLLRVQRDDPYTLSYNVSYLNLNRSVKNVANPQSNLVNLSTNSALKDTVSGIHSEISGGYDGDLWQSIESNLSKLVSNTQSVKSGKERDRNILPSFYIVNRHAGIISVTADSKTQKSVKKYLASMEAGMSSQVLIEAKVIEIMLKEEYATGLSWKDLSNIESADKKFQPGTEELQGLFSGVVHGNFGESGQDRTAEVLKLLDNFGTTKILSSPRVSALNNQQAVLTFTKNKPYFTVSGTFDNNQSGKQDAQPMTVTSTLHTIPIGLVLAIQPSVNIDTKEITMNIRPTISRQSAEPEVEDPAVKILNRSGGAVSNTGSGSVPTIEVREMDTVLKVRSGDVMVIGGLIENENFSSSKTNGKRAGSSAVKETIILIQATIIPSTGYYHNQDKNLYEKTIPDPRPLTF